MKEAYFFSHDYNARNDVKIIELRFKFGWEGYGLYWAIIESLREQATYIYELNKVPILAHTLGYDSEKLLKLIDFCFEVNLLVKKKTFFYSDSLMRRMAEIDEKRKKLSEAGRKGGLSSAKARLKGGLNDGASKKGKKEKEKKTFSEPTLLEVSSYVKDNNININAEAYFYSRSESDWVKINGQSVKDWKKDIRGSASQGNFQQNTKPKVSNINDTDRWID